MKPLLFAALLFVCAVASAEPGVQVRIGSAAVEASAVTDGAFHLGVSYGGALRARPSVYLSPNLGGIPETIVHDGVWIGVRTDAGELLIDQAGGSWTLRDAGGKTLIASSPIPAEGAEPGSVSLPLAAVPGRPFEVYGCGDGSDHLLQDRAQPHVGNGHAVVPYYWSPGGYAVLAVGADDNAPPSWTSAADGSRVTWTFPGDSADLYLMPADSLSAAARAYAHLSGAAPVPPRWTLGYLQSRWGWKDRAYIDDALRQFIVRRLPVDAFIFDFEWYTAIPDYKVQRPGLPNFQDFSFNPVLFPDPAAQIAAFHAQGVHFVGIRKPRLGNSALLAMARSHGWILPPGKSGSQIDARCLDFANPEVRSWYAERTTGLLRQGVDGWWDDEGEITYTDYYWWNQAEADALARVRPTARLWTIDRAFAPGLQRFGVASWSGDIHATWAELARTPTHLLNWSLAGMPYVACDIGGFVGETTPELLARWMEAGVFFPIMRAHSTFTVKPHFPWLFGPAAESAIRQALDLRYRLIPYYYSLEHETRVTGLPIMRPLALEFPSDPRCADLSDQWLAGPGLMAAPVLTPGASRSVYLPAGTWYPLDGGPALTGPRDLAVDAPLDHIPVYVRAGTVLPLGAVIQHTDELPGGPLEVRVYPARDGRFTLVEDDGWSTAYLRDQVRRTSFAWDDAARTLTWTVSGPYSGSDTFARAVVAVMDPDGVKRADTPLRSAGSLTIPR